MERDELKQWLAESFWSTRTPPTMSERVGIVQALVELSNAELLATCIEANTKAIAANTEAIENQTHIMTIRS